MVDAIRRDSERPIRQEPSLEERRRQHEEMRDALSLDNDWMVWKSLDGGLQPGPAQAAVRAYFRDTIGIRIDNMWSRSHVGEVRSPLTQWQCLPYFRFIAGVESSFTTKEAASLAQGRDALDAETADATVKRWLASLAKNGFLIRGAGDANTLWTPTDEGRWK